MNKEGCCIDVTKPDKNGVGALVIAVYVYVVTKSISWFPYKKIVKNGVLD